jgi:hypothetical protein
MRCYFSLRPNQLRFASVFFLLCFGMVWPRLLSASCPVPVIRATGEFFKANIVFTGTVISIRPVLVTDDDPGGWFYRVRADEIFRGPVRDEFTVYTEDSDVRFPLEKHKKYLLFAYGRRPRLEIDSCGNSALLSDARGSLERLRKLRNRQQPSEIEGWVAAETGGIDVSGVVVTITGRSRTYTATTNKDGWFHFKAPPGRYKVDFTSKEYYLNGADYFWYDPNHFFLHQGECASLQFVSVRHLKK